MLKMIRILCTLIIFCTLNIHAVLNDECVDAYIGYDKATLEKYVKAAAAHWNVDLEIVRGVIYVESRWRYCEESIKGAIGLMQVMPKTANYMGFVGETYLRLYEPRKNLYYGCRYIRMMLDYFNGDYKLALAAYYSGPGYVKKVLKREGTESYIHNKVYRRYVEDVISSAR